MALRRDRVGMATVEYHRQKGPLYQCVRPTAPLIDNGKEADWITGQVTTSTACPLLEEHCRQTELTCFQRQALSKKSVKPGHDVVDWPIREKDMGPMGNYALRSPSHYNGHFLEDQDLSGGGGKYALGPIHGPRDCKNSVDDGIVTLQLPPHRLKNDNQSHCDVTPTHETARQPKWTNLEVAWIHPDYPEQEVSMGGRCLLRVRAARVRHFAKKLDIFGMGTNTDWCATIDHRTQVENRTRYSQFRQKNAPGQAPERAKALLEKVTLNCGGEAVFFLFGILDRTDGIKPWCPEKTKAVPIQSADSPSPCSKQIKQNSRRRETSVGYSSRRSIPAAQAYIIASHFPTLVAPDQAEELSYGTPEINYSEWRAAPGVVFAATKTGDIFSAPLVVITDQTNQTGCLNLDASGALAKWKRGCYGRINLLWTRTAVKGQMDRHAVDGSGACLILTKPEGMEFTYALVLNSSTKNRGGVRSPNCGYRCSLNGCTSPRSKCGLPFSTATNSHSASSRVTTKKPDAYVRSIHKLRAPIKEVLVENLEDNSFGRMEDIYGDRNRRAGSRKGEQAAYVEDKKQSYNCRALLNAKSRSSILDQETSVYRVKTQSGRPYEVTKALEKEHTSLRDMDGRELPSTWNICNLKKCYL
ncbi:hypothetical protein Tco_0547519 [Tanacetum coccineum]